MAEADPKKESWFKRHKIITSVIVSILLISFASSLSGDDSDTSKNDTSSVVAEDSSNANNEKQEEKGYDGGMYKVGSDIPAGEYVVVGSGYLQISSDSTGSFDSIVENDNYTNRTIILIKDGQYVQFEGRAYSWEDAPKVDTSSGELGPGKYKAGVDFPAGEYKVTPSGDGYLAVTSTASESLDSIVTNDNFSTDKYITVQDGQYLKLQRATLKLK